MAAATLVRRTGVEFAETMDHRGIPVEVEDYELASARLQWARATTCLDMPAQREALDWHIARRDAAYAVMRGSEAVEETP